MASEFKSAGTIADIPKRIGAGRPFNQKGADALLAIVSAPGATASDGALYPDATKARAHAGAAKRLLSHVTTPDTIKTRAYADGKGWRWVVYLKAPEAVAATTAPEAVETAK